MMPTTNSYQTELFYEQPTERYISAVFKTEPQVGLAIARLLKQGVHRDRISIISHSFQSEIRNFGFLVDKDIISNSIKVGGILGFLFGLALNLLSSRGVLFFPFLGSVFASGFWLGNLLGAASWAMAVSIGAAFVSALVTSGLPKDIKSTYQARLQAGYTLVVVEVSSEKLPEVHRLIYGAGGEELAISPRLILPTPSSTYAVME